MNLQCKYITLMANGHVGLLQWIYIYTYIYIVQFTQKEHSLHPWKASLVEASCMVPFVAATTLHPIHFSSGPGTTQKGTLNVLDIGCRILLQHAGNLAPLL